MHCVPSRCSMMIIILFIWERALLNSNNNSNDNVYNIYCDESCHLEHDNSNIMVIGGIICPLGYRKEIYRDIKNLKIKHSISKYAETKWIKVSHSKENFYLELIDYFFDNPKLAFRAIFLEKNTLNHKNFNQTFDEFYYKMYYLMLKGIFESNYQYNIYLDIKDTLGYNKINLLKDICNKLQIQIRKEYSIELVKKIQEVRSHEIELIQLADLLIGAVAYVNRKLSSNKTKIKLIDYIQQKSGHSMTTSTLLKENKFNLFHWEPQKGTMLWD